MDILFSGWAPIAHTLAVGTLVYAAIVLVLRVSGKRTLAKMNAFDLVVTVAIGSTIATSFLSTDVSAVRGALALVLLVALQWVVASLAARSDAFQKIVKARPRLLLADGRMEEDALLAERVAREEVLAAVRAEGFSALEDVAFVVLETDGTFSVIGAGERGTSALVNVAGFEPASSEERTPAAGG